MLVEHSFVTTRREEEVYRLANDFLQLAGFNMSGSLESDSVLFQKGKQKSGYYMHFAELPQKVHIGFDRGRVNVAASIEEAKKVHQAHRAMMLAVANGLEACIAGSQTVSDACSLFAEANQLAEKEFRKRRKARNIRLAVFLFVISLPVLMLVYFFLSVARAG